MDAKKFWDKIDKAICMKGLTITEFAEAIGFKRETIYTQRRKGIIPCGEQVITMQEYLEMNNKTESPFAEYIPYLEKADSATLFAVRKLLDMPEKKTAVEVVV